MNKNKVFKQRRRPMLVGDGKRLEAHQSHCKNVHISELNHFHGIPRA